MGAGSGEGRLEADVGDVLRLAAGLGGTGDLEKERAGGNSTTNPVGSTGTSRTGEPSGDSRRSDFEERGHREYSLEKSYNERKMSRLPRTTQ